MRKGQFLKVRGEIVERRGVELVSGETIMIFSITHVKLFSEPLGNLDRFEMIGLSSEHQDV